MELLKAKAEVAISISNDNSSRGTPLILAVKEGHVAVVWALLRAGSGRLYIVGEVGHRVMAVAPLEDGRHAHEAAVAARPGVGAEHRSNSVTQLFIAAISGQEDTLDAWLRGCGGSGPVEGHGVYDPVTESCDGSMLEHTKRHFCLTTVNEGC
mmetsp:Transcript_41778/g.67125  ORF Transcript_41778/g.67125 Transcript_41778/m.67125 type:complete len:153 (+) Transcript_41778:411-869(+)